VPGATIGVDAVADAVDAREILDVDVHELARPRAFVASLLLLLG
jgi:hypothetical protein